jgi:hypothetical protein
VSRPGRRGIGSVQQLIDLVRCRKTLHQVCVSPGGDARAARPLAAVEPAWVRKTPPAVTVVRDAPCPHDCGMPTALRLGGQSVDCQIDRETCQLY